MATIVITSFFTSAGSPSTGLTPVITIYDLSDNSTAVSEASMTHVANGIYKYSFTTYDYTKDYAMYVDGGASLSNSDRYQYSTNANEVWDSAERTLATDGSSDVMTLTTTYADGSTDTFRLKESS